VQSGTTRTILNPELGRILLVDDEPAICRALQIAFKRAGFDSVSAETGENALSLLRTQHFDCMVLDLLIPDLRGDVLFELAASQQPHLRHQTLFISGDASPKALELIDACNCPFLVKPFDLHELINQVKRLLPRAADASA
jgi:DNA-binding response OmpR family regulator